MSVLATGISGLSAFKTQLNTTSHNVANVNTAGYSRQVVNLSTQPATDAAIAFIGNGVRVADVSRQFDQFLVDRVRTHTASNEDFQAYVDRSRRVDDIIADPNAGISSALQQFFNAVQDVSDDPTSTATRDVMFSQANVLVDRFHSMYEFLEGMRKETNVDIETVVSEVNALSSSIAQVNHDISLAAGATGNSPNDLLDRRDYLITELSKLSKVSTVEQNDGSVNVFLGNGQAVVIGATNRALSTVVNPAEADRLDITIGTSGGGSTTVTSFLSGGKLGGVLRFRDNVLDSTQNALGRLAMGLGTIFNTQHTMGMDLDGNLGIDFFKVSTPSTDAQLLSNPLNTGTASITSSVTDATIAQYSTADYELLTSDGTNWTITNRQTGGITTTALAGGGTLTFDGITVTIAAGAAAGDSYVVRPTRLGSRTIDVTLSNSRQIAAASPISVSAAAANTGTGKITNSGLTSRTGSTKLATPVTLTFDAANNRFAVSTGGSPNPLAYAPATQSGNTLTVTLAGLGDFSFTMSGVPANGDVFTLATNSNNTGGPIATGDNRNARQLADLQLNKTMVSDTSGNATASFVDLYSTLIGDVGTKTRQADINNQTQISLREQATTVLDEVQGVNLDEEAANLVHFQQAYQAATQVIRVANSLFDSLLSAVG